MIDSWLGSSTNSPLLLLLIEPPLPPGFWLSSWQPAPDHVFPILPLGVAIFSSGQSEWAEVMWLTPGHHLSHACSEFCFLLPAGWKMEHFFSANQVWCRHWLSRPGGRQALGFEIVRPQLYAKRPEPAHHRAKLNMKNHSPELSQRQFN